MAGKHTVDMQSWTRREHYRYFGELDDPYFGITAKADFTSCYMQSKQDGASFFLYSLHKILRAANAIDEFRYRVEDGNIVLYDLIGASPTIGREDGSFGFGVFEYHEDRKLFVEEASKEIARVKNASGLCLGEGESRNDLIYYSSIPWIDFTDLKHAGKMSRGQSIPRISAGRRRQAHDVRIGRTEPRACRRIPCRAVFQTVEYALVYMDSSLKDNIKVIAFDADDTLWANQPYFDDAEDRLCSILAEYGEPRYIKSELFKTEMQNMAELGYGVMAFTLSMIETALRLGGNRLSTSAVSEIYSLGRSLLRIPATPLPGVKDTLEKISRSCSYRTIVITKGNMLDQERKLECSGLKPFFDHVEIVSDKNGKTYSDLLAFLGIGASEFLMVGNSFKSDISPVLRLGGYGVYIPFHTTWLHEQTDEYDHPNLFRADNFRELENIVL